MGGFLGAGSGAANTDRGNQLSGINSEWGVSNAGSNVFSKGIEAGGSNINTGLSSLDKAKQYFQSLMGNRTAIQGAAAPAINGIAERADAAKAQQAQQGTARGGGTNAQNQMLQTNTMAAEDKAISGVQSDAAKAVEGIGEAQANIGSSQQAKALQALGLSADAANEIINSSSASRPVSQSATNEVLGQWGRVLTELGL